MENSVLCIRLRTDPKLFASYDPDPIPAFESGLESGTQLSFVSNEQKQILIFKNVQIKKK
jgi:hypothetical protein